MANLVRTSASFPRRRGKLPRTRGFTLIEIAVGLFIIALIMGGLLVPLVNQGAQRQTTDMQKTLEDIKETLLGFAVANTRLPCPASDTSNGVESFCTNGTGTCGAEILVPPNAIPSHGRCTSPYNGFVPAVTLGLAVTDAQGYAIDAWSTRIRYAITTANTNAFTKVGGMRNIGLASLAPDLFVCVTSAGITATTCNTAPVLAGTAPVVIYSLGPNWATGGTSFDEAANLNADQVFVSHVPSDKGTAGGKFDDIVSWLSENVLYNRMVAAGQLP